MNTLEYEGFHGSVEFDAALGMLQGRLLNVPDLVLYQGASVAEIEAAFQRAVSQYRKERPDSKPSSAAGGEMDSTAAPAFPRQEVEAEAPGGGIAGNASLTSRTWDPESESGLPPLNAMGRQAYKLREAVLSRHPPLDLDLNAYTANQRRALALSVRYIWMDAVFQVWVMGLAMAPFAALLVGNFLGNILGGPPGFLKFWSYLGYILPCYGIFACLGIWLVLNGARVNEQAAYGLGSFGLTAEALQRTKMQV